jgi:FeS assembly SUF system protein
MNEEQTKPERTHLPVLPHSGKVEQLRQEVKMSQQNSDAERGREQGGEMGRGGDGEKEKVVEATQPTAGASTGAPSEGEKSIEYKLLEGKVIAALSSVYDPEIPVNIYELGLIYKIDIDAEKNVKILMTLTAPACPVAGTLPGEVEKKVESIDEVTKATVELVWDPPWSRDMMSESALLQLGMY